MQIKIIIKPNLTMEKSTLFVISFVTINLITFSIGQFHSGCVDVKSNYCGKYGFNSTAFPNYIGQMSIDTADAQLGAIFQQVKFCKISRDNAEIIGCAIYIPLCADNQKIPPCKEDCLEVTTVCKINQIPGLERATMICGIFPPRRSGGCITQQTKPKSV